MTMLHSNANCSANFVVIALLPLLFFLTMLTGYLGFIPLNIPIYTLVYIGFIFFIFLLFIKHNANFAACKIRGTQLSMEIALKTELAETALTLNQERKSILNIDDFLNRYYIDIRNDNFVSVASSIFPMLGILGTFIAMAISMPNFSANDTHALDSEISLLLSGVGSAFFASIYGIFLSLLWTYFEKRGLSKIDDHFKEIGHLYASYVWSKESLLIHQYQQKDLQDDRFISALKETFNLEYMQQVHKEQRQSFKALMADNNQTFEHLVTTLQHISTEIRESLSVVESSANAIEARRQIEKNILDFTHVVKHLEVSTQNLSTQLDHSLIQTFEKIDHEIADIVTKLADFATHVSLESNEVQRSITKYHQALADKSRDA